MILRTLYRISILARGCWWRQPENDQHSFVDGSSSVVIMSAPLPQPGIEMVHDLILYFAIVGLCGAIFLLLHVMVIRAMRGDKLIRTLAACIALSTLVGGVMGWWALEDSFTSQSARLLACVGGALTFVGFAGVYCHLGPISVDRSVSSHIVELVYLGPGHRLKETELFELYTHTDVLEKRFRDCLETGIIERDGDELATTQRGGRIARIFLALGNGLGMRLWYLERYRKLRSSGAGGPRQPVA